PHRAWSSFALSLAGLPDEARQEAETWQRSPRGSAEWEELAPFAPRGSGHAYEGRPLDVEAEIARSRWKRPIAYETLGCSALGRGDRDEACRWFRQAAEHPPVSFVSYLWLQAIRERVLNDPSWPPWLAAKK